MEEYHKVNKTDWAYLAGILDGEGCLRVGTYIDKRFNRKGVRSRIQISMTDIKVIDWISEIFGGNYCITKMKGISKPVAHWVVNGKKAGEIARNCLPYMKGKIEQANLLIEFARTVKITGNKGHPKSLKKYREKLAEQSLMLNMKGVMENVTLSQD